LKHVIHDTPLAGRPATISDVLAARAAEWGGRPLFRFLKDGEVTGPSDLLSYADLDRRARQIAVALRDAGLAGERVLLLYPQGLEFISAFFGCLHAGVVAVPAYPPHPARLARSLDRLQTIAADAQAAAVLTTAALREKAIESLAGHAALAALQWIDTEAIDADPDAWRRPAIQSDALAFLQYTSGSTGQPRGVMVSHRNLIANLQAITGAFPLLPGENTVHWLPFYHDMGLIGGVMGALYSGCTGILMAPAHFLQRPARWVEAISHFQATVSGGPDFAFRLCAKQTAPELASALDLRSWRVAYTGAEPIRTDTLRRFADAFAVSGFRAESLRPVYGLAEATLMVTCGVPGRRAKALMLDPDATTGSALAAGAAAGGRVTEVAGCGRAIPGHDMRIVDPETREALPAGSIGELWVEGPSVAAGYWNQPALNDALFRARLTSGGTGTYLRTGDLALVDDDGEMFFAGRKKDLIVLRGRNYYPQDIEGTVEAAHPRVRTGCVAAFSIERDHAEALVVACEIKPNAPASELEAIDTAIREAIATDHDAAVHAIALLRPGGVPKTSSGKVRRAASRHGYLEGTLDEIVRITAAPVEPPGAAPAKGALERRILQLIAEQLGTTASALDPDVPFTRYGLDSLRAATISGMLEQELGRTLSPTLLYNYATVAALSAFLEGAADAPPDAAGDVDPQIGVRAFWRRMDPSLDRIATARRDGLYHFEKSITTIDGMWVECADGERRLMLCTHSYLGLIGHPRIQAAARDALDRFGAGSHGARLLGGSLELHHRLEARMAQFVGREAAIAISTGFATNASVIPALAGPGDWIFGDQWNHASIVTGAALSGASMRVYRHNDLGDLEALLRAAPPAAVKLVVTDAIFSMDGDIAPLPGLVPLCRKYGAVLMVDEAHSIGVLGDTGRGIEEHFGMPGTVDVLMGTFSKTLSSMGGYVAGSRRLIDYLKVSASGYVFSTAPTAPVIAASLAALDVLVDEGPDRIARLRRNTALFIDGLRAAGFDTGVSATAIIPIILGADARALALADYGQRHGLFVLPALPPAVPVGAARLRLNVTADHSPADLRNAIAVLEAGAREIFGGAVEVGV
jgi:8-amino-7-oxononanoate synthase